MPSPQKEPAGTGHCASNEPDVQVPSGSAGLKLDTFESIDKRLELLLGRVNKLERSLNQLNVTFDCLVANENGEIDGKISEAINAAVTEDFQTLKNTPMIDDKFIPNEENSSATEREINGDNAVNDSLVSHPCELNSKQFDN